MATSRFFNRLCYWKCKSPVSFRFTGNYILKEIFGVWNGFDANTRFIQLFDDASFGRFQGWIGISTNAYISWFYNLWKTRWLRELIGWSCIIFKSMFWNWFNLALNLDIFIKNRWPLTRMVTFPLIIILLKINLTPRI